MWISQTISSTPISQKPERAKITMATTGTTEATGSFQTRNFNEFAPFGFAAKMPAGTEVLMIPTSDGNICCGARATATDEALKVGEIKISSPHGGFLHFKEDGSVVINGVIIKLDGTIIAKQFDEKR